MEWNDDDRGITTAYTNMHPRPLKKKLRIEWPHKQNYGFCVLTQRSVSSSRKNKRKRVGQGHENIEMNLVLVQ